MSTLVLEDVDEPAIAAEPADPPHRIAILGRPRWAGTLGALLCLWASFWPTLMPRSFLTQGAISGLSMAFGYAVFTLLGHLVYRALERRDVRVGDAVVRAGWLALAALFAFVVVIGGLWMWGRWQNQQRDLLGMGHLGAVAGLPMLIVSVLVFALFAVIGRSIARGVVWIFRRVSRHTSRSTSAVITAVVVTLIGWIVFSGVVRDGFRDWANRSFGLVDEGTADGVHQPDAATVSGSPASLAAWDTLGLQGRSFVADATAAEMITSFQSAAGLPATTPVAPIRVYAGIDTADDVGERADLVVQELDRTHAFDRAVLVVTTSTGTGWIDPDSTRALELMYGGDTAIASMQYSFLPSWIAFLVDEPVAAEAGAALFDAVYRRWEQLPEGDRPKLIIYGLSLGSFGAEAAFAGTLANSSISNLQARTDGVLLAGPTYDNPVRQQITDGREAGSPVWRPVYGGGEVARWFNSESEMVALDPAWEGPRLVYVGHASDPVRAWSWASLWSKPAWMDHPRGPDVPKGGPWVPFVTFTQTVFDLMAGFSAPPGHGHDYRPEWPGAWAQVVPPPGWTAADTQALADYLDAFYASAPPGS